ncbi:hypothetical protein quinque_002061 [Culex quinquefasciatus]
MEVFGATTTTTAWNVSDLSSAPFRRCRCRCGRWPDFPTVANEALVGSTCESSHGEKLVSFDQQYQILRQRDPEYFEKTIRMELNTFDLLLAKVEDKLKKYSQRKSIEPACRLFLTLQSV